MGQTPYTEVIDKAQRRGDRYYQALLEIQQLVLNGMLDKKVDPSVSTDVEAVIAAATNPECVQR
jgi:hypothetical protein